MPGSVIRDTQALPITTAAHQAAGEVSGSGTAIDGANQVPFVLLLDENTPSRKVSPADEATQLSVLTQAQAIVTALGGSLTVSDATTHSALAGTLTVRPATSAVAALTSLAAAATSGQLLPLNTARRGVLLVNDATVATLYLAYAATASTSVYTVKLVPQAQWEMPTPIYTGLISCLWDSAEVGAFARITELS